MNLLKNTSMKHAMLKTQPSKKPSWKWNVDIRSSI
jgi:hypothetical protein